MANLKDVFTVDSDFFNSLAQVIEVAPKFPYVEGAKRETPKEQVQKDGVPVWKLTVLFQSYGALVVSVPSAEKPDFPDFSIVSFTGLRVGAVGGRFWANADAVTEMD